MKSKRGELVGELVGELKGVGESGSESSIFGEWSNFGIFIGSMSGQVDIRLLDDHRSDVGST